MSFCSYGMALKSKQLEVKGATCPNAAQLTTLTTLSIVFNAPDQ